MIYMSPKKSNSSKDLEELEKELGEASLAVSENDFDSDSKREIIKKVIKFTKVSKKQYGDIVKSVLIFGSAARDKMKKNSDIDVWVVLDDTAAKSTSDFDKVNKHLHLIAHQLEDLHIQTTKLTQFWKWMKMGSPELVNFLRYSLPIYDTGFIKPIKRMLEMGLLPPSDETIKLKAKSSQARMKKIELDIKSMVFELRYSTLDICQSVAMSVYKEQPDAKAVPNFLKKLVKDGKLDKKYVKKFKELNKLWKDIDHKKVKEIDVEYLKNAMELARDIQKKMMELLPKEVVSE